MIILHSNSTSNLSSVVTLGKLYNLSGPYFTYLCRKDDIDFPGGPVAKPPCSQCKGPGFDPWLGN